jgi:hypothetical protein
MLNRMQTGRDRYIYTTCILLELHSTTQTLTICTHTHPYEYTFANPTPMSTSEGPSTDRSGDSRSHQWRLVVDGNIAYHLTHNAGKSWKIQEKVRALGFESWWVFNTDTRDVHTAICMWPWITQDLLSLCMSYYSVVLHSQRKSKEMLHVYNNWNIWRAPTKHHINSSWANELHAQFGDFTLSHIYLLNLYLVHRIHQTI